MELATEPDTYTPNIDGKNGDYIDKIPNFANHPEGIKCLCGTRHNKYYRTSSVFRAHILTKTHQQWLYDLNKNKINYYVENEELKKTIKNQQLVIATMEKNIQQKITTIDYLSSQLNGKTTAITTEDLLLMD